MKNIFLKSLFIGLVLTGVSCESYLDVNDDPNRPLYDNLDPKLTLSAGLTQTSRLITGDTRNVERGSVGTESTNQLGNIMLNSWAGNVNSFTSVFLNEYSSNLTTAFYDNIWDFGYTNIANLQKVIDYNKPGFENHKGIAQIAKVFYMQTIVDLYGDCPYSEAFLGTKKVAPRYDDDATIYFGLYTELDKALTTLGTAGAAAVGAEDPMMGGDLVRWRQFANTLRLRLLIRQSALASPPAYVSAGLISLGALPATAFLQADVNINPGYNNSAADRQNQFYGRYGYNIAGAEAGQRPFICATKHVASSLNSTTDARRGRLFTLVAGAVSGVEQGALSGGTTPTTVSRLGAAYIPLPVGTDVSIGSSQSATLMTLSEVKFLLAEASFRYPVAFSSYNTQTLFEEGVRASFVKLGAGATVAASTTLANSYLAAQSSVPNIGWNAGGTVIGSIMYQKWVALMNINAGESWIDYVRTGFPVIPNAIGNTLGKPKRLLYPTSEVIANTANVPSQSASAPFASGPFWKI